MFFTTLKNFKLNSSLIYIYYLTTSEPYIFTTLIHLFKRLQHIGSGRKFSYSLGTKSTYNDFLTNLECLLPNSLETTNTSYVLNIKGPILVLSTHLINYNHASCHILFPKYLGMLEPNKQLTVKVFFHSINLSNWYFMNLTLQLPYRILSQSIYNQVLSLPINLNKKAHKESAIIALQSNITLKHNNLFFIYMLDYLLLYLNLLL